MLRALAESNNVVGDFSGFNFSSLAKCQGGEIFSFHSLSGNGICFVKDGDRFKWSRAVLLEETTELQQEFMLLSVF